MNDDKISTKTNTLKNNETVSSVDKFVAYLETRKVPAKTYYTYSNMNPAIYQENVNFEINAAQKKPFFNHYQNMVYKDKYKGKFGITEKPEEYGYFAPRF